MAFEELKDKITKQYNISRNHLNELIEKTKELKSRSVSWQRLDVKEKKREIDDFLFTPDHLPFLGKEYWFFLLTGLNHNYKDQLMVSFGRNTNNTIRIDGQPQIKDQPNYLGGIGETWFYKNGQTRKLGKKGGKIFHDKSSVQFQTDTYAISFSGSFPNYHLKVEADDEALISINSQTPKIGEAMEFFSLERANMAAEVGNVYLDFAGHILNEEFTGRSYMQKVVMSAPFIPWYWGRIVFENGSVLVFFLLWVDMLNFDRTVYSQGKFYLVEENEYQIFKDFRVQNYPGTEFWTLSHVSEERNIFVVMESYTNNEFSIKSKGEFHYNEMFVEVKEIKIRNGNLILDNDYFGHGTGSLEAASGFCF